MTISKSPLSCSRLAILVIAASCLQTAHAQRALELTENGRPVPAPGLDAHLPDKPMTYQTAEGQAIRVVVMGEGLTWPWALEFLPDGSLLVTERTGNLRIIRDGVLDPQPVPGGPEAVFRGRSGAPGSVHGYMDIAVHPDFDENGYIFLTYSKPMGEDRRPVTALARLRWDGHGLTDVEDIFVPEGIFGVSRIAFGQDGTLFMTTNGPGPQDPNAYGGKVLRLNDDGSVPSDNPFVGREGHKPEIYSLGHRTALALAVHPVTGDVWQSENGPNGGDEINIIRPGTNYGWPNVSYGRDYTGPWHAGSARHDGFEAPIVFWMPSVSPSGLLFYTGDALPAWKGDVFVGTLRTGQIPGTGHIERIVLNEKLEEMRRESLLTDLRQRVRDLAQGPDGLLYLTVDAEEGAILRIEPAS